ncbi:MAG: class I SAM-dependent methyltransferase [Bacilli bacterium]|nr:class I SAM-dependent methyltransferase [Bacilli bacterium]
MTALNIMQQINEKGLKALEDYKDTHYYYPLKMYFKAKKARTNLEYLDKKSDSHAYVLKYVEKTLIILEKESIKNQEIFNILETVLLWSDIAKVGTGSAIKEWQRKKYNLYVHNLGSFMIYNNYTTNQKNQEIISVLIKTHGLFGQYLRGENKLSGSIEIYQLLERKLIKRNILEKILYILNKCIIKAVNEKLWLKLEKDIVIAINNLLNKKFVELDDLERLKRLRGNKKENISKWYNKYKDIIVPIFEQLDLWYVESALGDFELNNFFKIFYIIMKKCDISNFQNLSFENFMDNIYYDRKGVKNVNLYKKRIIEKYLNSIDIENNIIPVNEHVEVVIREIEGTILFNFKFSEAASKLIEFCEVAEKTNSILYEKSIIMLYDLFEFRKDDYDWFYNEHTYLKVMNQSITYKSIILDYIVGNYIIDVGPGGGALMNMIEERYPNKKIVGIDIAKTVVSELNKYKKEHKRKWEVMEMDIFEATKHIALNSVDTVIFSSVIHELYSYVETDGKKFNIKTIIKALQNAYDILKPGGRIIIRDGIKTEPDTKRIIEFKTDDGLDFFYNYERDFKGRKIEYQLLDKKRLLLPVNDAMEFLYTYTWGIESYPREVQEQFGYFTPSEFVKCINDNLSNAIIIEFKHFLQEGYTEHLLSKINFYNEDGEKEKLPNSTCLVVIEKGISSK